jgi:hypothetical protein
MPTWGQLLQELNRLEEAQTEPVPRGGVSPYDILRRKYLKALSDRTGRATIVYATAWLDPKPGVGGDRVTINLGDIQGFMEAVSNVSERELDLFLHSPGGSPEAAESIVRYLRTRFDHIRAIVPVAAMSAATMVALAANEIVMGAHSQLGPIDPQFTIQTPEGPRSAPAQAIKDQFDLAKKECSDPANLGAWLPILRSYLPGLIAQCDHQRALAETFAAKELEQHMLSGEADPKAKAEAVAAWFADFSGLLSHGRRVGRDEARAQGLSIIDLEGDQGFQDAVLSVHHAVALTFSGTPTTKLIENHHGRAWLQQVLVSAVGPAPPGEAGGPQPRPAPAQLPGGGNRAERRQADRDRRRGR